MTQAVSEMIPGSEKKSPAHLMTSVFFVFPWVIFYIALQMENTDEDKTISQAE